jgi:hypothetical protein
LIDCSVCNTIIKFLMEFYMHLNAHFDLPGNHLERLGVFPDFSKIAATFSIQMVYADFHYFITDATVDLLTNNLKSR